jgi:RimJ/RimL family protein N-acetyltransferase
MKVHFTELTEPTSEIAEALTRWENDPALIPFSRPNRNQADLEERHPVTVDDLVERIKHHHLYLMYLDGQLVGEMNYLVDPGHLFKKEAGTAWIGIVIGEESARGKGVGAQAMQYLEEQIKLQGLKRIELGVFEFNTNAIHLYQKLGYVKIARNEGFTYWQGKMWADIRMEKYI